MALPLRAFERHGMFGGFLVVLLLIAFAATLPVWPYSRSWGYVPSGGIAVLIVTALILVFSGFLAVQPP